MLEPEASPHVKFWDQSAPEPSAKHFPESVAHVICTSDSSNVLFIAETLKQR